MQASGPGTEEIRAQRERGEQGEEGRRVVKLEGQAEPAWSVCIFYQQQQKLLEALSRGVVESNLHVKKLWPCYGARTLGERQVWKQGGQAAMVGVQVPDVSILGSGCSCALEEKRLRRDLFWR